MDVQVISHNLLDSSTYKYKGFNQQTLKEDYAIETQTKVSQSQTLYSCIYYLSLCCEVFMYPVSYHSFCSDPYQNVELLTFKNVTFYYNA